MRIINPHKKKRNFFRLKIIPGAIFILVVAFGAIMISSNKPKLLYKDLPAPATPIPSEEIRIKEIHSGAISKNSNLYAEL